MFSSYEQQETKAFYLCVVSLSEMSDQNIAYDILLFYIYLYYLIKHLDFGVTIGRKQLSDNTSFVHIKKPIVAACLTTLLVGLQLWKLFRKFRSNKARTS